MFLNLKMNECNICLVGYATIHINLITSYGRANIMLPNETRFHINYALYSIKSIRNLLNFKVIYKIGYHIETMNESNMECLYITFIVYGKKIILEKLSAFSSRFYHTTIKLVKSYIVMNQKFSILKFFTLLHDKLGHPSFQ